MPVPACIIGKDEQIDLFCTYQPQLVEYYYLWKKTPAAATTRPHRRHRRVPRRQVTPTLPSSNDYSTLSLFANESPELQYYCQILFVYYIIIIIIILTLEFWMISH